MLGLLSLEPWNDHYQTQARRSHVPPAISGLGSDELATHIHADFA